MFTFRFLYKNNYLLFLDRVFYTKERVNSVLLRILLRIKGHKKKVNFLVFKGFYTVAAVLGGSRVFFFSETQFLQKRGCFSQSKGGFSKLSGYSIMWPYRFQSRAAEPETELSLVEILFLKLLFVPDDKDYARPLQ